MLGYVNELVRTIHATDLQPIAGLMQAIGGARARKARVYIAGNGGSYSIAQHWATDFAKAADVRAYALGSNPGLLTALSNDKSYAVALSTELALMAHPNDLLICLSCSGASPNIVSALNEARKLTMGKWLLTGEQGPQHPETRTIRFASKDYGVLEDCFSVVGHALTRELSLWPNTSQNSS